MSSSAVSELIPQPDRPRLPLRVPVEADVAGGKLHAEVLGSTSSVLLLDAAVEAASLPALGTPIRLRLLWDRQVLNGRIAAHGVAGRFLVTLGERAIRRSRRFTVDLPGVARAAQVADTAVRVTDLSTGGARVQGITLPIGSEVELRFTPPGGSAPINVLGFVVRTIEAAQQPSVGVAFRLVQPSMDVLGSAAIATAGTA
jgi:PilZ domain